MYLAEGWASGPWPSRGVQSAPMRAHSEHRGFCRSHWLRLVSAPVWGQRVRMRSPTLCFRRKQRAHARGCRSTSMSRRRQRLHYRARQHSRRGAGKENVGPEGGIWGCCRGLSSSAPVRRVRHGVQDVGQCRRPAPMIEQARARRGAADTEPKPRGLYAALLLSLPCHPDSADRRQDWLYGFGSVFEQVVIPLCAR
jgi:hypothetical protein